MSKRIFAIAFSITLLAAFSVSARADEINNALARGHDAFQRGQYQQALFEYRAALQWPGAHEARAHFNIGVCHYRLGQRRAAIAAYRTALKLRNNQYPAASYALGVALQDAQEHHAAHEAFAQAVKASGGKHTAALFELGLAAQRVGDDRTALKIYQQVLAQERLPAAHNNLGVILARFGQWNEALGEFEAALKHARGQFAEARDNLALCRQLRAAASNQMIAQLKLSAGNAATMLRGE